MIESVRITPEALLAHNLEVDGYHTFFVGEAAIWVHNGPCGPKKGAVKAYDVGEYGDLKSRSLKDDGLDIHEVPQRHPASQLSELPRSKHPAMALPRAEHQAIAKRRGKYDGSMGDLISEAEKGLRDHTKASDRSIGDVIGKAKDVFSDPKK